VLGATSVSWPQRLEVRQFVAMVSRSAITPMGASIAIALSVVGSFLVALHIAND